MRDVKVLDGGFSTQLSLVTGDVIDCHPLWTARYLSSNPEAVLKTHLDFLTAGAEIIISNSYQASIGGFVKHLGMDEKSSYQLIKDSIRIARRAVDIYMTKNPRATRPKIAGSIGPYGACLNDGSEYTGNYVDRVDIKDILEWHKVRIRALVEEGVDFLALETIPALSEAIGLIELMKEYPDQKIWVSFQCKDDRHIAHGEKFKEAVKTCWETNSKQLMAVGCNCINPKLVKPLLASVEGNFTFVVYPNNGEEYNPETGWSGIAQEFDFTKLVREWLDLGVRYVGGCCRTHAGHIEKIKEEVEEWSKINEPM